MFSGCPRLADPDLLVLLRGKDSNSVKASEVSSFFQNLRYHSSERPAKRLRCENPKYQTMPPKSKYRLHSDERPFKRPKNSELRLESSLPDHRGHHHHHYPQQQRASSFTLPHRSHSSARSQPTPKSSQKVTKTASFHVPTAASVKRENSLTSQLQNQSMGIHKLIFDRLNNNDEPHSFGKKSSEVLGRKCECASPSGGSVIRPPSKYRYLVTEEQRKLVKFRRFLRAAHICSKSEFLSGIEAIRRRQKREARRSIVDEHGIPPLYTQSR